jgi:hypothetical protein
MALTRRAVLLSAGALGAGATLSGVLTGPATAAEPGPATDSKWTARRSDNGWAIDPDAIDSFRVEGSPASLHHAASAVLLHVARRWHYEVVPLHSSRDVLGHRTDRAVRAAYESNYLSGSAIALLGAGDGLWPHQEAIVRDILADCGGVVRWGADLSPRRRVSLPDRRRAGCQALHAAHEGPPRRRRAPQRPTPRRGG